MCDLQYKGKMLSIEILGNNIQILVNFITASGID